MTLEDYIGDNDGEEWMLDSDKLGITMTSYYEAIVQALNEMYASPKTPVNWIADDLAPRFKPQLGSLRRWKDDVLNELIDKHRLYRYKLEEDKEMAKFLTYRDGIEHVFKNGLWCNDQSKHYRLKFLPVEKGEGRE